MTRDLINIELPFMTHKDSIHDLYEIKDGIAIIGKDTLHLRDSIGSVVDFHSFYDGKIKTYVLWQKKKQSNVY
jgi:hypothetical protein